MCAVAAMPADYEMMVSCSPPVFRRSAAGGPLGCCGGQYERALPSLAARRASPPRLLHLPPAAATCLRTAPAPAPAPAYVRATMPVAAPRRPCLVVRPEEAGSPPAADELGSGDLPSPTRLKKKVVFADDKGLALTQVRVMTEPSNVPPVWTLQFLEQVTRGISAEVAPEPWEVTFPQPASDYLDFRRRIDTENVSLENVIVRESEEAVVGTVKVRNLSFHKEVLVRVTSDAWATQEDVFCTYVSQAGGGSAGGAAAVAAAYVLYDTFSFRLTLPPRSRRIEFCVCFRCDHHEFWDNNHGKNYVVVKKAAGPAGGGGGVEGPALPRAPLHMLDPTLAGKFRDAVHARLDSWSEFASWNHLVNDVPYW